jgi:hypothetical protein
MADLAHAGAEPGFAAHERQLVKRRLTDFGEPLRRQRFAGDVRHHLGQIAGAALRIENSRFFAAARAEADELHDRSLRMARRTRGR